MRLRARVFGSPLPTQLAIMIGLALQRRREVSAHVLQQLSQVQGVFRARNRADDFNNRADDVRSVHTKEV